MSRNYHTPIVPGALGNIASINNPIEQLDSALSGIVLGEAPYNALTFATGATLTHNGTGSITITNTIHTVVQGSGSNLFNTINGGANGDLIILLCTGVRFGLTGNIDFEPQPLPFNPTDRPVMLLRNATKWVVLTDNNQFVVQGSAVYPSFARSPLLQRNEQFIRAGLGGASGDMLPSGVGITQVGTRTVSTFAGKGATTFQATAINTAAGFHVTTPNVCQAASNPILRVVPVPGQMNANINGNGRFWIGFNSVALGPGNLATVPVAQHFHGVRFSTTDTDIAMRLWSYNAGGTVQQLLTTIDLNTVTYFEIELTATQLILRAGTQEFVVSNTMTPGIALGYQFLGYNPLAVSPLPFSIARVSMDSL